MLDSENYLNPVTPNLATAQQKNYYSDTNLRSSRASKGLDNDQLELKKPEEDNIKTEKTEDLNYYEDLVSISESDILSVKTCKKQSSNELKKHIIPTSKSKKKVLIIKTEHDNSNYYAPNTMTDLTEGCEHEQDPKHDLNSLNLYEGSPINKKELCEKSATSITVARKCFQGLL